MKQVALNEKDEVEDDYMDVTLTPAEVRAVELSVEADALNKIYAALPTSEDKREFARQIAKVKKVVRIQSERLEGNTSKTRFMSRMKHMIHIAQITGKKRGREYAAAIDSLHGELNAYIVEVQEDTDDLRYNKLRKFT